MYGYIDELKSFSIAVKQPQDFFLKPIIDRLVGVVMPQTDQPDPLEHLTRPVCLRCRAARMSLTRTEEEYPGYTRRMFECPVCGETMTQWGSVTSDSEEMPT